MKNAKILGVDVAKALIARGNAMKAISFVREKKLNEEAIRFLLEDSSVNNEAKYDIAEAAKKNYSIENIYESFEEIIDSSFAERLYDDGEMGILIEWVKVLPRKEELLKIANSNLQRRDKVLKFFTFRQRNLHFSPQVAEVYTSMIQEIVSMRVSMRDGSMRNEVEWACREIVVWGAAFNESIYKTILDMVGESRLTSFVVDRIRIKYDSIYDLERIEELEYLNSLLSDSNICNRYSFILSSLMSYSKATDIIGSGRRGNFTFAEFKNKSKGLVDEIINFAIGSNNLNICSNKISVILALVDDVEIRERCLLHSISYNGFYYTRERIDYALRKNLLSIEELLTDAVVSSMNSGAREVSNMIFNKRFESAADLVKVLSATGSHFVETGCCDNYTACWALDLSSRSKEEILEFIPYLDTNIIYYFYKQTVPFEMATSMPSFFSNSVYNIFYCNQELSIEESLKLLEVYTPYTRSGFLSGVASEYLMKYKDVLTTEQIVKLVNITLLDPEGFCRLYANMEEFFPLASLEDVLKLL